MKGKAPVSMLISSLIGVMVTSLAGCESAGRAGGESHAERPPREKTVPEGSAKTEHRPSKEEDEVMFKGGNGQYDGAVIKALSVIQEARERPSSATKTITVSDVSGQRSYTLTLDLSAQVLRLDIPTDFEMGREKGSRAAPLHRSFSELKGLQGFISAALLAYKAKQFDDGLFAAVELAANSGAGSFPSKRALLENRGRG